MIFWIIFDRITMAHHQTQVDAQVDAQVGAGSPSDRWTPRTRPHLSLTYWLKHAVQKETL
jgi:hypothetical protein